MRHDNQFPWKLLSVLCLLVAGCAGQRPNLEINTSLRLPRLDVSELREAFKNAGEEKRVVLPTMGEAVCLAKQCGLSFKSRGLVVGEPSETETEMLGYLVFTKKSAGGLLSLIDRAREKGKVQTDKGRRGKVECDGESCTLSFAMRVKSHVLVEGFFTQLQEAPDFR